MKFTNLKIISAAVLTVSLIPTAYSQDTDSGATDTRPAFDREQHRERVAPGRRGPGQQDQRNRRGDNAMGLILKLDSNRDSAVSLDEFLVGRIDETDRIFEALDSDGDGLISLDEADARPHRPQRPDRPERPEIDREEVIACVRETIADYDPPSGEAPEDRFGEADTNADGHIDLTELSVWLEARSHRLFERLDFNDDGLITLYDYSDRRQADLNLRRVIRACINEQVSAN